MKYLLLLFSLCFCSSSLADDLVFYKDRIGKLKLTENTLVSPEKMRALFQQFSVTHAIGQGDSANFHHIKISTKSGEDLFSLYSYFDHEVGEQTKAYDIDLLVIVNEKIITEKGIKVGDKVSQLVSVIGKALTLSANHHNNSIGQGRIYYQFDMPNNIGSEDVGMVYLDPSKVTIEQVYKEDPVITSISWPSATWD